MECMHCGAEWTLKDKQTKLANCPFCGGALVIEKANEAYTDVMEAMNAIVEMKGLDYLIQEPSKVLGIFSDITCGLQREFKLLKIFYNNGTHNFFSNVIDISEGDINKAIRSLQENAFMDISLAKYIVDIFLSALGQKKQTELLTDVEQRANEHLVGGVTEKLYNNDFIVNEDNELSHDDEFIDEDETCEVKRSLKVWEIYAGNLCVDMEIELDSVVYCVKEFQCCKSGKGAAFVRVVLENVLSGGWVEKIFRPTDILCKANIKKELEENDAKNELICAGDLKSGLTIELGNYAYQILDIQHEELGNVAIVKTKLKNIIQGDNIEKSFGFTEKISLAHIDTRKMQYLYVDESVYYFMDIDTYDLFEIDAKIVADSLKFVKKNEICKGCFYNGDIFCVVPPFFVELEVTETEPGFKGNTATGATKSAIVETGATISVPLFIEQGNKIKIDAIAGEYLCRV